MTQGTTEPVRTSTRDRYKAVNGAWPVPNNELPPLSAQEAVSAFRILYRHRFDESWSGQVVAVKGRHRRTWNHGRVTVRRKGQLIGVSRFIVAHDQGWHDFIHDLSHWIHRKQYPGQMPHKGSSHAAVEIDLIEQVVNRGWLQGSLKRKGKPTMELPQTVKSPENLKRAKPDVKVIRAAAVNKRLKAWRTRLKRAETAVKKLTRQARYYERALQVL